MEDTGVCLHNLGIFLGHLAIECTRQKEILRVTLHYFVDFLNILD